MEHCHSPDGVTSVSVRPYYAMLSRVSLALAMGFLVNCGAICIVSFLLRFLVSSGTGSPVLSRTKSREP